MQLAYTDEQEALRSELRDYYDRAVRTVGGHEPHLLGEAFRLHERYMTGGHMRATP